MSSGSSDNHSRGEAKHAVGPIISAIGDKLESLTATSIDESRLESLREDFRKLHAQLRIHHARYLMDDKQLYPDLTRPEHVHAWSRLMDECMPILGMIDRTLRTSDSILSYGADQTHLLLLRMQEIVSIVRRHVAEEEWLLCQAVYQDIGGES
ncbi:MAG: hypothetical protein ACPGXK_00605 [Phycisphaerae bacterium]